MKHTKIFYVNKFFLFIVVLILFSFILFSYNTFGNAQSAVDNISINYEDKIFSKFNISDNFDNSSVLVVIDKHHSGHNKSQSGKFSKLSFIKSIEDLTKLNGNINDKKYYNDKDFRQILKVNLKECSKQNVLDAIEDIQKLGGVLWTGANINYELPSFNENSSIAIDDNRYNNQWGLHGTYGINAPEAWNYSTGAYSVKVGILDSGISPHEDLENNIMDGWNFYDNNNDTTDLDGHGTAIAGIIGATGKSDNGVLGVNHKVKMAPLKISYSVEEIVNGKPQKKVYMSSEATAKAITWAIDNDIDILNASWGGQTSFLPIKTAINNFQGLFVCAAGNYMNDNDTTPYYPTNYSYGESFSKRVISVGAITSNGDIWCDVLPGYGSHYGSSTVSLFAPGGRGITTTCLKNSTYPNDISGYTDNFGGTSAAAPFVTGVAALLYTRYLLNSHHLEHKYIAKQIKATILKNVTIDNRYSGKCASGGRLNAAKALMNSPYLEVIDNFGYYDGWYFWIGKVNLNIDRVNAFYYNDNGELVFKYKTDFSFALGSNGAFNAVKEITGKVTFELKNSTGEIININNLQSHICDISVNLISYPSCSNNTFTFNTETLENDKYTLTMKCDTTRKDKSYSYIKTFSFIIDRNVSACIADDSMITLADGNNVAVQDLKGNEELLVWNMMTGKFDSAPILFIDKEARQEFEVTNLRFSDGTSVKVIDEHGFWDFDLNKYVFLRNDADKYIGHWFNEQTVDKYGNISYTKVQLIDVDVKTEITSAWSPVTYGHLCYYVNGMLTMPGATGELINIFDVNPQTMTINKDSYLNDIEKYGLFTYEEFTQLCPVPEYIFDAFGGQYLKVAIGKGLTTVEEIQELISRYSKFWE